MKYDITNKLGSERPRSDGQTFWPVVKRVAMITGENDVIRMLSSVVLNSVLLGGAVSSRFFLFHTARLYITVN